MVNSSPKDVGNCLLPLAFFSCTMYNGCIQMARDEARHGVALKGMLERYFK